MIITRVIFRVIGWFEKYSSHQELSLGICLGMLLGLSSINSLQFWLGLALFFVIRANLTSLILSQFLFALVGYLGSPLFNYLGDYFLTRRALFSFWARLYESPIIPFTNFYNSYVLGRLMISVFLFVPLYAISKLLINLLEPVVYHWWRTTKLYILYRTYKPYAR
jgi:uncharacterized protein (TIGR03546 family)